MSALILAILEQADRPLTAYAIQAQAAATGVQLYPTQIYRTVRRLVAADRVTRIESANAYMASKAGAAAMAVCGACGNAVAVPLGGALDDLSDRLRASGFVVAKMVIEAIGECRNCAGR